MGLTLKTTGVFLLLLCLLNGTAAMASPTPQEQAAQDSALPESGEPQGSPQPPLPTPEMALDSAIADYQAAIANREAEYGPFDSELSEMSFSLGKTLQHRYRFHEAMAAYRRAMHLHRVNEGVYSLAQEPMLRGIIDSQSALGQIEEASDSYSQLLWLYRKTYGDEDIRLVPVIDEISRWHLDLYSASGRRDDVYHLHIARGLIAHAMSIVSEQYGHGDTRLLGLLQNSALANYYLSVHQKNYPGPAGFEDTAPMFERFPKSDLVPQDMFWNRSFYQNSRKAGSRIIAILEQDPSSTAVDKAKGHIAMGDLMQLYNRSGPAMKSYQRAFQMLSSDPAQQTAIEDLFGAPKMLPRPLTVTPTLMLTGPAEPKADNPEPSPLTPLPSLADIQLAPPAVEYVMVAADISAEGLADNITTLEVFPSDTDREKIESMESRARKTISASRFRPRFENGNPVLTKALPVKVLMN